MRFSSLSVQNIRAHAAYSLPLSARVTVITGSNGSGKTSLLEALYVSLRGSSFKGSDTDMLQRDAPWWRIDVATDDDEGRVVKFDPSRTSGRKQFVVSGKTQYRLPEKYKYPVVLFEPDDLRLLHGSPTRRRQFIDRFIAQLDPQYGLSLRRYERALKQRNTLLKQSNAPADGLFVWDVAISEYGAYIIEKRTEFIDALAESLEETYRSIAGANDVIGVRYSSPSRASTKQKLLRELHERANRDRILGYTSAGPHRHDVLFEFNSSPALTVASRGEVRSIVLALKFLEVEYIERLTDTPPLILLDDVFSELDEHRQASLLTSRADTQVIVTSTNLPETLRRRADVQHVLLGEK